MDLAIISQGVKGFFSAIISPITKAYETRQVRKQAQETAKAKLVQSRQDNEYRLQLTEQEIDAIGKGNENESWKDEYLTIVVTLPYLNTFICNMASVLLSDPVYANAANAANDSLRGLGIDIGGSFDVVLIAGLSIRGYKLLGK